ncbi:MAG: CDP-glucose 4,6-dehydratase [Verrucomicrobia bacterium]|nr:CDP-glucose 4,6-dehydratase [Verrucomicrobiota bacterium]
MGKVVTSDCLSSFKGRRVFVTGHTGFKGSWLTFLLNEIGAEVLGYALPPVGKKNHFELLELAETISHVEADIRDGEKLTAVMNKFQPEFVFHLAAQALVRPSYSDPKSTFETNVMGSVNLLEAVRKCESVRSLVYITSDKCYENLEWLWGYRENDRLGGHDPYSASKASAEIVFSAYVRSFFFDRPSLGAASTRAGNVIGGGDWAVDRIIPDCVRAIESQKTIDLRNPSATRPWQHVLEPLSGYLLLAASLRKKPSVFAGSWNFGPSSKEVRTVLEVAEHLIARFGSGSISCASNENSHHEAGLLQLNCDRAHQMLEWYPRWDFERTLDMTVDWYRNVQDGDEAKKVTREQLYDYFPEIGK